MAQVYYKCNSQKNAFEVMYMYNFVMHDSLPPCSELNKNLKQIILCLLCSSQEESLGFLLMFAMLPLCKACSKWWRENKTFKENSLIYKNNICYKIIYKRIKKEIISQNLILLCLEHIYYRFLSKWKSEKILFITFCLLSHYCMLQHTTDFGLWRHICVHYLNL